MQDSHEPYEAAADAFVAEERHLRRVRLDRLQGRLDQVRRLGRNRRRRVQLPLVFAGVVFGFVGLAIAFLGMSFGTFPATAGIFFLVLSVMPTQTVVVGIELVVQSLLGFGMVTAAVLSLVFPCSEANTARYCRALYAVNLYAVAMLSVMTLRFLHLALGVLGTLCGSSWLPSRPPRAAHSAGTRTTGVAMIAYAPVWFAFGIFELQEPWNPATYAAYRWDETPTAKAATHCAFASELVVLGALLLWPPLRTRVQARLASMGEGVAAAAGISELLGYAPTRSLIDFAQQTLRSVSLGLLQRHHLDVAGSSAEAFLLSTPAALGSIDAFVSHSWHDPPEEKWALLQAWRERFVLETGREPVVWLDRACLHPAYASAQLPALPVYCAACDKLLALRGPTYLNRLWCIVIRDLLLLRDDARRGRGRRLGAHRDHPLPLHAHLHRRGRAGRRRRARRDAGPARRRLPGAAALAAALPALRRAADALRDRARRGADARGDRELWRRLRGLQQLDARPPLREGDRRARGPPDRVGALRRGRNPFRRGHVVRPISPDPASPGGATAP